jgi:hypothetical protein
VRSVWGVGACQATANAAPGAPLEAAVGDEGGTGTGGTSGGRGTPCTCIAWMGVGAGMRAPARLAAPQRGQESMCWRFAVGTICACPHAGHATDTCSQERDHATRMSLAENDRRVRTVSSFRGPQGLTRGSRRIRIVSMGDPSQGHEAGADAPDAGPQTQSVTAGALLASVIVLSVAVFFGGSIVAVGRRWLVRDETVAFASPASPSLAATTPPTSVEPTTRLGEVVVPAGHSTGVVRAAPGMNSARLTELPAGTTVEVLDA